MGTILRKPLTSGPGMEEISKDLKVPPNQIVTDKFPVLTFGGTPKIDLETWELRFFGSVEQDIELGWNAFKMLPRTRVTTDFHCVTQWSRLDNTWEGVSFREVVKLIKLKPDAKYVMAYCYGGYTTNLDLESLLEENVLFADTHDGKTLEPDHGGPLRLVVPNRYGWKSAKWVNALEFTNKDAPGFWETRGYHMRGEPWSEERFGFGLAWETSLF
jgi:DMSO/TMAO reductase YedYZ molybdopterin-dependent catalytic subunit